jgi:hypothetical protein
MPRGAACLGGEASLGSNIARGKQHRQESRMPRGAASCPGGAACLGGAASPGKKHAMGEQHAQGENMPWQARCLRGAA